MALQNIVETGAPANSRWKHLRPHVPVQVDLRALFPLPAHHERVDVEGGLDLRRMVVGRLSIWAPTVEGDWVGLVTYPVGESAVSHWVPAWLLRPIDELTRSETLRRGAL